MTYEEIKNLLKSVRSKKSRLLAMQSYIEEERQLMVGVSASQYDGATVVHSQANVPEERMAKYIDRYNKWKERYDKLFEEMCAEEDLLCEVMKGLSPEEYEVILNRYLRGISRRRTADIMGYTEDGVKSIQRRAFKKMGKP